MTRALLLLSLVALLAAPVAAAGDLGASINERADGGRAPRFYRLDLPRPQPDGPAQRIVSLAPVVTETLFALGLGERVVGVTRYCDRPEAARALPKVGGYVDPQVERVLALKPDLVVAMPSFGQRAALDRLRERGVPVLVVFGDSLDEVKAMIRAVSDAAGEAGAGTALVRRMEQDLARVASSFPEGTHRPRAVLVFQVEPLVIAGPATFPDEALRLAGGRPAVPRNSPAWPVWSLEALLFLSPDALVAAEGPKAAQRLRAKLAAAPGGKRPPRVVSSDHAILMRPGPHLAEDVAALAALLHPEKSAGTKRAR